MQIHNVNITSLFMPTAVGNSIYDNISLQLKVLQNPEKGRDSWGDEKRSRADALGSLTSTTVDLL